MRDLQSTLSRGSSESMGERNVEILDFIEYPESSKELMLYRRFTVSCLYDAEFSTVLCVLQK